ncbi:unnamed protein product [Meloidogyne enterolobii]|uniref:Uncharacterized protein n=1 Tax=Meloidogyne enterolobii TaxID=390850 RepID=A0ACB0ZV06_MELEN
MGHEYVVKYRGIFLAKMNNEGKTRACQRELKKTINYERYRESRMPRHFCFTPLIFCRNIRFSCFIISLFPSLHILLLLLFGRPPFFPTNVCQEFCFM